MQELKPEEFLARQIAREPMNAVVTTGRKEQAASVALARRTAEKLGLPYEERRRRKEQEILQDTGADFLLVAKQGSLRLLTAQGEFFFHPSMGHIRVKNLRHQMPDNLCLALGARPGMRILDGTLGFGADAVVESYAVGEEGYVLGLEASPLVHEIVSYGLRHFPQENPTMIAAMRRVHTLCADACEFLRTQQDNSFDVVYFDPMFRHPLLESKNIAPLREVADHRALTPELIAQARRVARERVVMKEAAGSGEFSRLGFTELLHGKYSPVYYGIQRLS